MDPNSQFVNLPDSPSDTSQKREESLSHHDFYFEHEDPFIVTVISFHLGTLFWWIGFAGMAESGVESTNAFLLVAFWGLSLKTMQLAGTQLPSAAFVFIASVQLTIMVLFVALLGLIVLILLIVALPPAIIVALPYIVLVYAGFCACKINFRHATYIAKARNEGIIQGVHFSIWQILVATALLAFDFLIASAYLQ